MNISTQWRWPVLGFALLFFHFATHAQYSISPGSGTCISYIPNGLMISQTYTFTVSGPPDPGALWAVKGELQVVEKTPTTLKVRATGYAKSRIYYFYKAADGCGLASVFVDVYKRFPKMDTIQGPSCLKPGQPATYSIRSIGNLDTGVGLDSYQWKINGIELASLPDWKCQGSGSAIILTAPAHFTGSAELSVVTGKCNEQPNARLTIGAKAIPPVFAGAIPSCLPTNNRTPFTLSVIQQPGTSYKWTQLAGSGWLISTPVVLNGFNTVSVTPDGNANEITVMAQTSGGCEPAITSLFMNRQLATGTNTITGAVGCLATGIAVNVSITNPPTNCQFIWSAPSGWTLSTSKGPTAVFIPSATAQSGAITVSTGGCSAGISMIPVLAGNKEYTFSLSNLDCGLFRVGAAGFDKIGAVYQWYLNGVYKGTTTGNSNSFTFDPWAGQQTISVNISKALGCVESSVSISNLSFGCAVGRVGLQH